MDKTGMQNPLLAIMGRENYSNNNNFLDET